MRSVCFLLVCVLVFGPGVQGTNPALAEIGLLKRLYQQMNARLQQVEAENQQLKATATRASHHANDSTVAFMTRLSDAVELAAIETVHFDDVPLNLGGGYNPNTGLFTAPEAGVYQFAVSLTSDGKEGYFAVKRNTDTLSGLYIKAGLWYSASSVLVERLGAGDTVQVKSQYFPANLRQGKYSVFSGFLIK